MSQGSEASQSLGDDKEAKKSGKRSGPFYDSSSDEDEVVSLVVDGKRVIGKARDLVRLPSKYPAVVEANYLRDEVGWRIVDEDEWGIVYKLKKPWMTAAEEEAFFAGQSFERCYKCVELGHNMDNCPQQKPRCRRCDRPHRTRDCRSHGCKCGVCGGLHVRGKGGCKAKEFEMTKEKMLIQYYSGDLS